MNKQIINPWQWQDQFGYAQAVEISNSKGTLYCSGQAAIDAHGKPLAGTMADQMQLCLSNLEQVIHKAGYHLSHIVRLNIYTTSIPEAFEAWGTFVGWMKQHHILAANTLLGVQALAFPELKIEIEATVVG